MRTTTKPPSSAHVLIQAEPDLETAPRRRAADVLVDIIAEAGVEVVFGIPGGTIAPLYDALLDHPEIRVVTTKHEGAAMFAAAGYAQTSGKLGVVLVTSGPGVINAMTGLASAFCDGLPVLLLAGEVPRALYGKGALQEGSSYHLDILGMTRRIAKLSVELQEANAAPSMLRRSIATAMSGRRGPIAMTIPIDVASTPIAEPIVSSNVSTRFQVPAEAVERIAGVMSDAERPVIFVGAGARPGFAHHWLKELAEKLQAPVMTTPKGKGIFPESHPLSLGVFGIGGHPSATRYLECGIDVMLVVGSSLGDLSTNGWSALLRPTKELIQVDVEANQIGRNYPVTRCVIGLAEEFLARLCDAIEDPADEASFGVQYFTDPEKSVDGPEGRITPQRACWEIQRVLPADTIFASDVGEHSVFATHYLRIDRPDGFILMNGLGSMGQSLGAAMGARLAKPGRAVAVICGDGCFAMTCGEVATAVGHGIPIIVFVFNDERLGMVELGNTAIYGRTPPYPTRPMDVTRMAAALGASSFRVERTNDILALPVDPGGLIPLVVDVRIDRGARMPKSGRFEALGNAQKSKGSPRRTRRPESPKKKDRGR